MYALSIRGRTLVIYVLLFVCTKSQAQFGLQDLLSDDPMIAATAHKTLFGWSVDALSTDLFLSSALDVDGYATGLKSMQQYFSVDMPHTVAVVLPASFQQAMPGVTIRAWLGRIDGPAGAFVGMGWVYHNGVADRVLVLAGFADQAYGTQLVHDLRHPGGGQPDPDPCAGCFATYNACVKAANLAYAADLLQCLDRGAECVLGCILACAFVQPPPASALCYAICAGGCIIIRTSLCYPEAVLRHQAAIAVCRAALLDCCPGLAEW